VILIHRGEEGTLSAVSEDMPSGMRKIASELVALGHRRIAALRERLAEWNIPLPES